MQIPKERIFDQLVRNLPDDATIQDVSVGIFWTYVRTQYGSAVSATAHRWFEDPPGVLIPQAGSLIGMPVKEIVPLYESSSLTARSLANAAVSAGFSSNAMTGERDYRRGQDLLESVCKSNPSLKRIALVGHFHFADELKNLGLQLDVYEMEGRCGEGDIPNTQMPERLPLADIVMMTSATLITHTTEEILRYSRENAQKYIVGPSVPLHPLLWDYGFDAICASIITDDNQVAVATRQGANHKQLTGSKKVNFLRPASCSCLKNAP